jgi:hypothetical protein
VTEKPRYNPLWLLFLLFGFVTCQERPVLPFTPSISIDDYYFQIIASPDGKNLRDSLVVKVKFEDGDGDLGLNANETNPPYHLYDIVLVGGDTLQYGDNDTLPEYNCFDYEIITTTSSVGGVLVVDSDTIYVQRNPDHYNFFLTFLIKEGDEFVEYNTYERLCAGPFHGRFFILNTAGDVRPLTGILQYGFISSFRLLFRNDIVKLRIQIQDRNLNKSNIVETDEFNISEIARPPQ